VGKRILRDPSYVWKDAIRSDQMRRMFYGVTTFKLPMRVIVEHIYEGHNGKDMGYTTCKTAILRHLVATLDTKTKRMTINELVLEEDGVFHNSLVTLWPAKIEQNLLAFDAPRLSHRSRTDPTKDTDDRLAQIRPMFVGCGDLEARLCPWLKNTPRHRYPIAANGLASLLRAGDVRNQDGSKCLKKFCR
jgi:hypothetical protein